MPWGVADDVHMDGLGWCFPYIESGLGRANIGFYACRECHFVGVALLHGMWKLQENPVVEFASEGVIGVHGFGFTRYGSGMYAIKRGVVGRVYSPIV